jgi:hypothetical protein
MRASCILLAAVFGADCLAAERAPLAPKKETQAEEKLLASFTARIESIRMIPELESDVKAIPVGSTIDLRFVIFIEILAIDKPAASFEKKGRVVLATHSPALFFGIDYEKRARLIGKVYSFKMYGYPKPSGPPVYWRGEIEKLKPPQTRKKVTSKS